MMTFAGLEPERLKLDWVSASEGERFSKIVTEFTERIRALEVTVSNLDRNITDVQKDVKLILTERRNP